jgi:hypothetical protein
MDERKRYGGVDWASGIGFLTVRMPVISIPANNPDKFADDRNPSVP